MSHTWQIQVGGGNCWAVGETMACVPSILCYLVIPDAVQTPAEYTSHKLQLGASSLIQNLNPVVIPLKKSLSAD